MHVERLLDRTLNGMHIQVLSPRFDERGFEIARQVRKRVGFGFLRE
jgi:hypothetical protein